MKKLIAAGAALLIGVAGGTGWTVVTHEPATLSADSLDHDASDHGDSAPGATVDGHDPAEHDGSADGAVPADSAEAPGGVGSDSTYGDPGATTTGPAAQPAGERDAVPSDASASGAAPVSAPAAATPDAAAGDPVAQGDPQADDGGADRLARIFSSMRAREAARVLSRMDDGEVRAVLARMGARQAAAVLTNMEPERAAVLSRSVLGNGGTP